MLKNHNRESKDFDHERKTSVQNWNTDFLKAVDKYSYQIGLIYEYNITKNIFVSPSIIFGEHRYEYRWNFTFDYFFDQRNATSYTTEYVYAKKMQYVSIGLNVGYRTPRILRNGLQLETKLGLNYAKFLNTPANFDYHNLNYSRNDTVFTRLYAYTEYSPRSSLFYYGAYLGATYPAKSKIIQEYRLGVEFMRSYSFLIKGADFANIIHGTYYNENGDIIGADVYINRFRNFALSFSLVF